MGTECQVHPCRYQTAMWSATVIQLLINTNVAINKVNCNPVNPSDTILSVNLICIIPPNIFSKGTQLYAFLMTPIIHWWRWHKLCCFLLIDFLQVVPSCDVSTNIMSSCSVSSIIISRCCLLPTSYRDCGMPPTSCRVVACFQHHIAIVACLTGAALGSAGPNADGNVGPKTQCMSLERLQAPNLQWGANRNMKFYNSKELFYHN